MRLKDVCFLGILAILLPVSEVKTFLQIARLKKVKEPALQPFLISFQDQSDTLSLFFGPMTMHDSSFISNAATESLFYVIGHQNFQLPDHFLTHSLMYFYRFFCFHPQLQV